jgi:hypothetical protein
MIVGSIKALVVVQPPIGGMCLPALKKKATCGEEES